MKSEINNLIGHYQFKSEEENLDLVERLEKPILHVISVDEEDLLALVDFDANPEWLEISSLDKEEQVCILDKKYQLNLKEESYFELEDPSENLEPEEQDELDSF